jgi:predicted metal-dependent peptidase
MTLHVNSASDRVLKARTDVILTNRFYGTLVSNVEAVLSKKIPTAATNGKTHLFNPDFVLRLNAKELKFVQRHESEHDARHHSTRRGGRDPKEWNISCDYAINIDLVDEIAKGDTTMELPRAEVLGGKPYVDAKYRGMSAEDIYRCRQLDQQRAEQEKAKQQPQPKGNGDDKEDDANDEAGNEEAGDNADKDPGDEAGDDEGGEAGDKDGDDSSDADGDEKGGGADGDDELESYSDENTKPEDTGEGDGDAEGGEAEGEGTGESDGEGGEGEGPSSVTGDMPGGMGEVLDASDDPMETSNEEAKWERVVRMAATIGKGDTPGRWASEIAKANQPKQDWREVLRAYFDQGAVQIETWNRPNRRFAGQGITLPGSQREGVNSVVFLIDTSGSVDDIALAAVAAETQAALDEGIITKLTVVMGDTQVTSANEYAPGDQIDFTAKGRGGTVMRPLFDWVRDNVDNPSLIVCFTDGYIETEEQLGAQPACEVLWAFHGYPNIVKGMIANAPWQAPGIDVGAH